MADRVEAGFLGGRDGLGGRRAGALLPHLGAHDVDDAFGHEPVGGELAAGDREHPVDAVAGVVVDDAHASGHVTGVGVGDPRVFDEGACARPGVHRAGLAETGHHGLAGIEHLLDLVGGDGEPIRILGLQVGGADDAHRVIGHQDVAVGGPDAPVEDRVAEAVVHGDHDARSGDDIDAVALGHRGNLSRPRAAAVEDEAALDAQVFARPLVAYDDCGDAIAVAFDGGHAVVGQDVSAVGLRGADRSPHHLPSIDGPVLHRKRPLDARV